MVFCGGVYSFVGTEYFGSFADNRSDKIKKAV